MNRILIAEDEDRIASFLEKGLRSNGFVTTRVGNGRAAYDEARYGDHDLLVLDVGLPEMDGFTVLHRLREDQVTIPVLILTARDSVEDKVAGLAGGRRRLPGQAVRLRRAARPGAAPPARGPNGGGDGARSRRDEPGPAHPPGPD